MSIKLEVGKTYEVVQEPATDCVPESTYLSALNSRKAYQMHFKRVKKERDMWAQGYEDLHEALTDERVLRAQWQTGAEQEAERTRVARNEREEWRKMFIAEREKFEGLEKEVRHYSIRMAEHIRQEVGEVSRNLCVQKRANATLLLSLAAAIVVIIGLVAGFVWGG